MRPAHIVLAVVAVCLLAGTAAAQGWTGATGGAGSNDLIDLMQSTVQPQSWDSVGGPGSAAPFDSNLSLVVSQTQETHEEIVDLLEQLRRLQDLQVTVEVPFNTVSDSFYEKIGVGGWSGNIKGMPFSINQGAVNPQFGGYDPNAGLKTGVSFRGKDWNVDFPNIEANQGYRQSAVTQAPSVTLFNGQRAYVSDTSQSPFVISQIPVVGGVPIVPVPTAFMYVPRGPTPVFRDSGRPNHRIAEYRRLKAEKEQKKQQHRPAEGEYFRHVQNPNIPKKVFVDELPKEQQELIRQAQQIERMPQQVERMPQRVDPMPQRVERMPQRAPAASGDIDLSAPTRTAAPVSPARRLASSQGSSASRAVPSVAEAKRLHQAEASKQNSEARVLYERGLAAEERGKPNVAKIYYNQAVKRATGDLRAKIEARLQVIVGPR